MLELILKQINGFFNADFSDSIITIGVVLLRIAVGMLILSIVLMPLNHSFSDFLEFLGSHVITFGRFLLFGFLGLQILNGILQSFRIQSCEEIMANRMSEDELESFIDAADPMARIQGKANALKRRK